jgi:predicted DNA-binding WGR domain protein
MTVTYLEADTKFWEITVNGAEFTTRFGKLGAAGQSKTKSWDSEEKCQKEADKLIRQKTGKGYSAASSSGAAAAAAPAKKKAAPAKKKAAPAKKKAAGGSGALAGCTICISGSLSQPKAKMTQLITDNGGSVAGTVTKATTHLLTSDADFLGGTSKVSKARGMGLPILHEDFVHDSIKNGSKANEDDYNMADMHDTGDNDEEEEEEEEAPPKKKAKTGGGNVTYLEADTKFWEITVEDTQFTTRFGKLGASGQSSTKNWPDAEKCQKEADKLIRAKKKKGYA